MMRFFLLASPKIAALAAHALKSSRLREPRARSESGLLGGAGQGMRRAPARWAGNGAGPKKTLDNCHLSPVAYGIVQGFKHKGLKRLFENAETKGVRQDHVEKLENILAVLNRAGRPEDMNLPGFRLHALKGDLKGFWSVTVRANWRVVFRFHEGDAYDVDLVDYH
jgi:proteic killer suppression protein